jgi:murein DD-endopeptidase MepM/ murein hydrolase activator NlpD
MQKTFILIQTFVAFPLFVSLLVMTPVPTNAAPPTPFPVMVASVPSWIADGSGISGQESCAQPLSLNCGCGNMSISNAGSQSSPDSTSGWIPPETLAQAQNSAWETFTSREFGYSIKYPPALRPQEKSTEAARLGGVPSDIWFGDTIHVISRIPPLPENVFSLIWGNAAKVKLPQGLDALRLERVSEPIGGGPSRTSIEYLVRADGADFFLVYDPLDEGDQNRQTYEAMVSTFTVLPQRTYIPPVIALVAETDGFDFPVDPRDGSWGRPTGSLRYNQTGNGTRSTTCYGKPMWELQHAGEDWMRSAGSNVYAVANGQVIWAKYENYPGAVVIIMHTLPSGTSNPWGGNLIYSMYGHLDSGSIISQWTEVRRGQLIGKIHDWGTNSHVHFEMRRYGNMQQAPQWVNGCYFCNTSWPGPGYTNTGCHPDWFGYTHPSNWIDTHRPGGGANQPPRTPSLVRPHDWYESNDGKAPELCWQNNGDPNGDAVQFYAEIYQSAVNANSGWISGTCWRPSSLDGKYYTYAWHVKAKDSRGAESGWSETWHFTIRPAPTPPPNQPPHTPSLVSPHDWYESNDGKAPELCWQNNGDPNGDAVQFYAEIYQSAVNANSGWISGTCWRPSSLDGKYYTYAWHVKAKDSRGAESGWSETWHFTIRPAVPDLRPYAPVGYSAPVVPSSRQGTRSANTLYAGSRTFFDWHFVNSGTGTAPGTFYVELWLDGTRLYIRYPYPDFAPGQIGGFDDWAADVEQPGWHTVRLIVDPDNVVSESDENNNVWEGRFLWQSIRGWKGEYFSNPHLEGNPYLTRDDSSIDFDWPGVPPDPSLPSERFSVRWTRTINFQLAGIYRFRIFHDDGARLWINETKIFDNWCDNCREEEILDRRINSGLHTIKMEMWQNGGWSGAKLSWQSLSPPPSKTIRLFLPLIRR